MIKDSIASGYRGDINGLRSWAVVAVILYHFGVPGFGGGFVGVDVFFVISGFLMTGIVVDSLERGKFSLIAFYLARARRILPALIVLCAVLLALGWWVLLPVDYKALGTHAVFSLAFLSNIKFWREAGYFDAASHEKWLLHTWSLAVEWQFYLLLPLVLLAVWKWRPGRRPVMVVMMVGLLASLALSVVATPLWPKAAFFVLPTRAWEMLAGGLVWLLAHVWPLTARRSMVLEAAGIALVIGSIAGFDTSSPWPGWRALVPVLGTAGVLLAARSVSGWTGHPVAQWLGTRSYSLYLWHWPIVVALNYLEWQADPKAVAAGLLLTLVLGDLSYRLVESTARVHLGQLRPGWDASILLGAAMVVAAPVAGILAKEGIAGRFPPAIEIVSQEALNTNPRKATCQISTGVVSPSCLFGGSQLRAIIMGDSHADAVVSSLAAAAPNPDYAVAEWSYSGCPTLFGVLFTSISRRPATDQCDRFLNWASEKLMHAPPDVPLVIVNRTTFYAVGPSKLEKGEDANVPRVYFTQSYTTATPEFISEFTRRLTDTACELAKNRPVYLVRPIPEMGENVPNTARSMLWRQRSEVSVSLVDYHQRHSFVWAAQDDARKRCGVKILDPLPYLCWDGRCHGSKDGRSLYSDDNHLSEYGNKLLVPMFSEVFEPFKKQLKPTVIEPNI